MQLDAWAKCEAFMEKQRMLDDVSTLILGVSGGSDSMFLLYLMKKETTQRDISLEVIHVHHGIRGEEADRDAAFVVDICRKEGIACQVVRRDIPAEAKARHMTLEEAGRHARMEIFENALSRQGGGARIALAHQENDVAETLLLNLSRGTGLKGMGAVPPVRGPYLRPLLVVTKNEIEAALVAAQIPWVVDSTNEDDDATRNRIRHHVLPYLEKEVNSQAAVHLAEAARISREASDFISSEAQKRLDMYRKDIREGIILQDDLLEEPSLMQEEVVRLAVGELLTSLRDFSGLHVHLILDLFGKTTGKRLNMPRGLIARRIHGGVLLSCGN